MRYNYQLRTKIRKMSRVDPLYTIQAFKEYLSSYPNDILAHLYYADVYLYLGMFEETNLVLNEISEVFKNDKDDADGIKIYNIDTNVKYLMMTGRYKDARELYDKYYDNGKLKNTKRSSYINADLFYAYNSKMQGEEVIKSETNNRYIYKQIIHYDYDRFIYHMKCNHLVEIKEKEHQAIFVENFPLEKVIEEIKTKNLDNIKLYNKFYDNIYFFKYDYNGSSADVGYTDYFTVATFMDTKDIITMYPSRYGEFLPHIDLNYLREDEPKTRKISQVEKFNNKYKDFIK